MKPKKRWWEYSLNDLFIHRRWKKWKKMALKAIAEGRTAKCITCEDPIVPGDLVAICYSSESDERDKEYLEHAGLHFTLNEYNAFCTTGAVIGGRWDGKRVVQFTGLREAIASKVKHSAV